MHTKDCGTLYKINAKTFADEISQFEIASFNNPLNDLSTCLRKELIYWAIITYKTNYTDHSFIEFIADMAFTEAILKFRDDALDGKITDKGATIKTLVFAFFKIKLKELLQQETRRSKKENDFREHAAITADATFEAPPLESQLQYKVLMQAIERLRKKDKQIILRRHLLQEKPEQIAVHLKITSLAVNNKLYRAMKRLKDEINKIVNDGVNN